MLPIPPSIWHKFFDLRITKLLASYAHIYFHMIISIFVLLFADSVRELRKYSNVQLSEMALPQAGHHIHMRQFRAQRNFYIAGGTLFMFFVINRLVKLTLKIAQSMADAEASKRQAMSASRTASTLLSEKSVAGKGDLADKANNSNRMDTLNKELRQANTDFIRLKERFDALDKDYKFLQNEHRKQEVYINELKGHNESHKDK
ncbi:hypothetical protein GJ496_000767 [Pomphorhynchus laevis]|nr:hypothetical protein GJ496_000767 [Pomphorhynchus laevis]